MIKTYTPSLIAAALMTAFSSANAAVYTLSELATSTDYKNFTPRAINNAGTVIGSASGYTGEGSHYRYNFPVDVSRLAISSLTLSDADAVAAGNISAGDLDVILDHFTSGRSSSTVQKAGDRSIFQFNSDSLTMFELLDVTYDSTGELSYSTDDKLVSLNNTGWSAGYLSAPYQVSEFEDTSGNVTNRWTREFDRRAVVRLDDGSLVQLNGEITDNGGYSAATDVSDTGYVVGYVASRISESNQSDLDACLDADNSPDRVCSWADNISGRATNARGLLGYMSDGSVYDLQAFMWKLDATGAVESTTAFSTVADVNDAKDSDGDSVTNSVTFESYAWGVNNSGVAVGSSDVFFDEDNDSLRHQAVVYKNGETITFVDQDTYSYSFLKDINDSGIAIGWGYRSVNGSTRAKMIQVDTTADTPVLTEITGAFEGSSTLPAAINNAGTVVGEFEYESFVSDNQIRRRHGFTYDIASETFQDLNDLLSCEQRQNYTIIAATDISEDGEITVQIQTTAAERDAKGTELSDQLEDVVLAAKLTPVSGGSVDDCSDVIEDDSNERKGAGLGFVAFLLLPMAMIRRWNKKN